MNKGMLTVGIIMLALMGLLLINVISNYSTGNELDYYLVKETVVASIDDAIDVKYYRDNGTVRMDKDKFVEHEFAVVEKMDKEDKDKLKVLIKS